VFWSKNPRSQKDKVERKRELLRLYSETARVYDRRYQEVQKQKYEWLAQYLPKRVGRLLDIGCGSGMFLQQLVSRCVLAAGVDLSPEMLKLARTRVPEALLVVSDAEFLPFRDRSFDVAVSVTVLQNVPSPEAAVREAARVVRESGLLVFSSLRHKHSVEDLERLARSAGLVVEHSGLIPKSEDVFCVATKNQERLKN
jgi:ubiquinone/menaquinone biosynthesis C-methylase UbiE